MQLDTEPTAPQTRNTTPDRMKALGCSRRMRRGCAGHIVHELPLAQSTVSEHLRILRSAGLAQANENGPRVSYCIVPSGLTRLKALLAAM